MPRYKNVRFNLHDLWAASKKAGTPCWLIIYTYHVWLHQLNREHSRIGDVSPSTWNSCRGPSSNPQRYSSSRADGNTIINGQNRSPHATSFQSPRLLLLNSLCPCLTRTNLSRVTDWTSCGLSTNLRPLISSHPFLYVCRFWPTSSLMSTTQDDAITEQGPGSYPQGVSRFLPALPVTHLLACYKLAKKL